MIRYLLFRLCTFIWQRLPLKVGYTLACLLGDITYFAWPRGRRHTNENMRHVLGPQAQGRQVARMARQSLRNYMKYLVDFIRFPKLREEDIAQSIVFEGWSNFDKALEAGKGAIFIGMHIGNWDLAAAAICLRNYPLNVIAETFSPPKLNDLVQGPRMKWGMKVIPMERAARQVIQALRQNEIIALLIDRPSPDDGVPVRFFDALTRVPAGAATLALKTGARVVPGSLVRLSDTEFLGIIDRYVSFQPTGDLDDDVQALTQRIVESLENTIRQYPDQWYMFRRMWVGGGNNSP